MFERFTTDAREAVVGAQAEARALGHDYVGTEHLLIALLADPAGPLAETLHADGVDAGYVRAELARRVGPRPPDPAFTDTDEEDAAALKAIGIDLDAVRKAVESTFGEGALRLPRETAPAKRGLFARFSTANGYVPFTRRTKQVLGLALREALRLNQNFIAPEHIALGMIREGQGLGVLILTEKGVDLGRVRDELDRSLQARVA